MGYGSAGGGSAARALRDTLVTLHVPVVEAQPGFNLFTDFKDMQLFTPAPTHDAGIIKMFDQLENWAKAMQGVRKKVVY